VTLFTGETVASSSRASGLSGRADDKGLETIVAGELVLSASTVHSPTILIAFGH